MRKNQHKYPGQLRQDEIKYHRRRLWIAENGPCKACGSDDALEVDHIDPASKTVEVDEWWGKGGPVLLAELAKCQVLCFSCHRKKSGKESQDRNGGPTRHGTYAKYIGARSREGCRCAECCAANTEYQRQRRRRLGVPERIIGPATWVALPEGVAHGTRGAYEHEGCRCEECRAFNAARSLQQRERKASGRTGRAVVASVEPIALPEGVSHGTRRAYANVGCRCQECRTANAEWSRKYRVRE